MSFSRFLRRRYTPNRPTGVEFGIFFLSLLLALLYFYVMYVYEPLPILIRSIETFVLQNIWPLLRWVASLLNLSQYLLSWIRGGVVIISFLFLADFLFRLTPVVLYVLYLDCVLLGLEYQQYLFEREPIPGGTPISD